MWELPAPRPVVWERLSHPDNQVRFMADESSQRAATGARGPAWRRTASTAWKSYDLEVLDWIPYELQALRFRTRGITFLYNSIYEDSAAGATRLTARIAPLEPRIGKLLFPLIKRSIRQEYEGWMRSLEELLSAEADEPEAADDVAHEAQSMGRRGAAGRCTGLRLADCT